MFCSVPMSVSATSGSVEFSSPSTTISSAPSGLDAVTPKMRLKSESGPCGPKVMAMA